MWRSPVSLAAFSAAAFSARYTCSWTSRSVGPKYHGYGKCLDVVEVMMRDRETRR